MSGANGEEKAEAEFMANYVWKTLLALYERLELERRLALRNVDSNLVIGGDAAAALKLLRAVRELSAVVRDILRARRRRLLLLDYKYTDDYRYLSQARFKALAYLYEFDADCAVVVAPTPKKGSEEDEEAFEHKGFYDETVRYGGAYISIDSNGKILAIVYADPRRDAVESPLKALRAIINLLFSL